MKKGIVMVIVCCLVLPTIVGAQDTSNKDDPFVLIPESNDPSGVKYGEDVSELGEKSSSKQFWRKYNDTAKKYGNDDDLGAQMASGIMNRDTILAILGRIVKFIANAALVVGSAMIIYAGYLYAVTAITGSSVDMTAQAKEAIKRAMIGIVIVIFSYAILRIIIHAFL